MSASSSSTPGANGLTLALIDMNEKELVDLEEIYGACQVNELTQEQVKKAFDDFVASLDEARQKQVPAMLKMLAVFIFVNGIHESLPNDLKVKGGVTWGNLKTFFSFRASKKQSILRWVVDIMFHLRAAGGTDEKNLFLKQAAKWGLEDELNDIPVQFRFFGSYFHPSISLKEKAAVLKFQKLVIKNSGGGATAK